MSQVMSGPVLQNTIQEKKNVLTGYKMTSDDFFQWGKSKIDKPCRRGTRYLVSSSTVAIRVGSHSGKATILFLSIGDIGMTGTFNVSQSNRHFQRTLKVGRFKKSCVETKDYSDS